ncbi:hypothetical protein GC197_03285 [bacterium]|nr:hypothetical protein [bacterium]
MQTDSAGNKTIEPRIYWALTTTRRLLFVAALLSLGIFDNYLFYPLGSSRFALRLSTVVPWGMDAMHLVLAAWLVTRSGVWTSWLGWLRAGVYILAFGYGRMLLYASEHQWTNPSVGFHLPGTHLADYEWPAIELWIVLMMAWMLTPVAMVCSTELASSKDPVKGSRRFSILAMIGFVTTAAIAMGWVRFLTSDFAPQTGYNGLATSQALMRLTRNYAPFYLASLVATVWILLGLSKRWRWSVLVLVSAILLNALLARLVAYVIELISGKPPGNIAISLTFDSWLFISGRMLTVWGAFCVARLLGVKPYFGRSKVARVEVEPEVSPIDAG